MAEPRKDPLRARMAAFGKLAPAELAALDHLHGRPHHIDAGKQLIHEGQVERCGYILKSGWACSTRLLNDGGRQVIDVHVPGDFIGISQLFLPASSVNHEAVSVIDVAEVRPAALLEVMSSGGRVAEALLWAIATDEARLAARLTDIGRCSPQVRTARCLLELSARAVRIDPGAPHSFRCPLSQYVMADMLGLSAVHLNRVLRSLREMDLASFRNSVIQIHDLERLIEFADMDAPAPAEKPPMRGLG